MTGISQKMTFDLVEGGRVSRQEVALHTLIVAGWTGRDQDTVERHIQELEALGVSRPETTPIFYRVALSRRTQAPAIEVLGASSSGEVEFVLLHHKGKLWVGLASDHTDRDAESHGVSLSKQMCDKPIGKTLWAYDDVKDHWDALELRAVVEEDGIETVYQEGAVSGMRSPEDLIRLAQTQSDFDDGVVMLCGTHAVIGSLRHTDVFKMRLHDPILNRDIEHAYAAYTLPVLG